MSAGLLGALAALAVIDGACSGFRAVQGRTGLVRHTPLDRRGAQAGVLAVCLGMLPPTLVFGIDVLSGHQALDDYSRSASAMLVVLVPYAAVVGLALAAYAVLGWRHRYLAMAAVLGPFTLARPAVAAVAALNGIRASDSASIVMVIVLGTAAALLVEPALGHCCGTRLMTHEGGDATVRVGRASGDQPGR